MSATATKRTVVVELYVPEDVDPKPGLSSGAIIRHDEDPSYHLEEGLKDRLPRYQYTNWAVG
jgi:hypothetical protein